MSARMTRLSFLVVPPLLVLMMGTKCKNSPSIAFGSKDGQEETPPTKMSLVDEDAKGTKNHRSSSTYSSTASGTAESLEGFVTTKLNASYNQNNFDSIHEEEDDDYDDDEFGLDVQYEDDEEEDLYYTQCGPHQIPLYYDFAISDVVLPKEEDLNRPKYEEEFFTLLNGLNVDDWDVTLQQDADMNYHLLFERDDEMKTFLIPKMFNNLTETEIIGLALDYFDHQDEEWEVSFKEERLWVSSTSIDNSSLSPSPRPVRLKSKARRQREAKILWVFFEQIGGTTPLENDGRWLSNETVCNWYGVVCGHRGQHKAGMLGQRNPKAPPDDAVTAIQLNNLELDGTLPTELAMLEYLSQLILRNNKIHGTIPSSLAYASGLCILDLSNNLITGSIPSLLPTKTRHMYQIHLNNNRLNGTLPRNMRAWKRLWL